MMKVFLIEEQLTDLIKQVLSAEDKYTHKYYTTKDSLEVSISANMNNVKKSIKEWLSQPGRIK